MAALDRSSSDHSTFLFLSLPSFMSEKISAARHTVTRLESLKGGGKRPSFTPRHHVARDTGMRPSGPIICESLRRR